MPDCPVETIDLLIVVVYLSGVVAFGLWIGRAQHNLSSYWLAGRDTPWWVILGSIVATETSTVTFLSVPGIAFAHGGDLRFLQLAIGFMIARFLVILVFLPHYFRGELFSAYEVLAHRFGGVTKQTASLLFVVTRTLADGLRLYLTAIVLQHVVGIGLESCIVVIGIATMAYTCVGGMKSVVWNDVIQFIVYIGGALLAGWVIVDQLPGGWAQLIEFGTQHDKFRCINLSWDVSEKYTLWTGLAGGIFLSLSTHGTDQLMVQRYLCARNQRDAAKALGLSGIVVFFQFALFLMLGIGLACFYDMFPPAESFQRNDEVLATFIVNHMPVGVVGITLAAVFSAAMSTLSSSLNSSATAIVNDFYLPLKKQTASDANTSRTSLRVSRGWTIVLGFLQISVGIAGAKMNQSVVDSVLAIAGFSTGIILGVFFLGVLTKEVTQRAALTGLVGGLIVTSAAVFGTNLAWPWFTVVGALSTYEIGTIAAPFSGFRD